MLESFAQTLAKELQLTHLSVENRSCNLYIDPITTCIRELDTGLHFTATIRDIPKQEREKVFAKLLHACILGQGTGGAVIGIDTSETYLTLSLAISRECSYPDFKEKLEEFVNYATYWKEELDELETRSGEHFYHR